MRTTSMIVTISKWFHTVKAARVTTASQVASALRQLRLATPLSLAAAVIQVTTANREKYAALTDRLANR